MLALGACEAPVGVVFTPGSLITPVHVPVHVPLAIVQCPAGKRGTQTRSLRPECRARDQADILASSVILCNKVSKLPAHAVASRSRTLLDRDQPAAEVPGGGSDLQIIQNSSMATTEYTSKVVSWFCLVLA